MWMEIFIQLHLASYINVVIYILDNSEKLAVFQFWKQTLLFKRTDTFWFGAFLVYLHSKSIYSYTIFFRFVFKVSLCIPPPSWLLSL